MRKPSMSSSKRKRRAGRVRPGRNEPCPCGSGRKYKKCHGALKQIMPSAREIHATLEEHAAKEALRRHQQGEGKPIISAVVAGHRVVAVGDRVYFGQNQKTFIDFLDNYIGSVLGVEWGSEELKKPLLHRHQILQWHHAVCSHKKRHASQTTGEIQSAPFTGLMKAYYGLVYNLYLLQHNADLQALLVRRLKHRDSFYAAYYETFVAAWFILAGFELAIEDESDPTRTHAEFIATRGDRSYSVEAKTRTPNKNNFDVGNQLYKALQVETELPRFVFIDINVGNDIDPDNFVAEVTNAVRGREPKLRILGEPAPPAYVFVTNQPYHLRLDGAAVPHIFLGLGFKIPDFGHGVKFSSLIEAHRASQKHADADSVKDAFENYQIPTTFDGEISQFAFGEAERRFKIGQMYEIGKGVRAELTAGLVMESEQKTILFFQKDDHKTHVLTAELTAAELAAYRAHPDTFFGRVHKQAGELKTPMELFEFFLKYCQNSPRKRLLEFMKDAPNLADLERLPVDELRLIYAEGLTHSVMAPIASK